MPAPACETSRGGRPKEHPRREVVDAIRHVVDTGCKWRALPAGFPPWRTVWGFLARWARGRCRRPDPRPARRTYPPRDGQRLPGSRHRDRLPVREGRRDRRQGQPRLRRG
ncbi:MULTISPECIES: transposase [Streptomyces]|uniref:transposase n=1 Tax=Streptomyces TaxID=1883 RepID=UPI001F08EAB1|nr:MULTISPECIES: transposase [Streptomyces]